MKDSIALLDLKAEHIPLGMQLKEWANWNQVEADWQLLLAMSKGGTFVATFDGKPVGTLVTVSYEESFNWMGMVLVDPSFRGKGIGTRLLQVALAYAAPIGPVLLDATAMGQPLYTSLGFQSIGEIARLELSFSVSIPTSTNLLIRPMKHNDLIPILAYDGNKVEFNRAALLYDFFQRTPRYALVAYQNEQLVGYCLGRAGSRFEHLGPLVANRQEIAVALLAHALAAAPQRPLIMDIPLIHTDWQVFLLKQGFGLQRLFTRMGLGDQGQALSSLDQYAIAGPALG